MGLSKYFPKVSQAGGGGRGGSPRPHGDEPGRLQKPSGGQQGATDVSVFVSLPQVEKKTPTTVLTAALLLSGIPAEVINRSMDTYRRMGDVFADLCVYFFTFVLSHEVLLLVGSETP